MGRNGSVLDNPPPYEERIDRSSIDDKREVFVGVIEEGREWYGYRDEGIRRAGEMFRVDSPSVSVDSLSIRVEEEEEGGGKGDRKEKGFWHGVRRWLVEGLMGWRCL
jgi:hypothetical protein